LFKVRIPHHDAATLPGIREKCTTTMHHESSRPKFGTFIDRNKTMNTNNFFADLQNKLGQVLENSPAKDLEKNVKAMLTQGFSRLDLVTREEFDIQAQVLARTRAKLDALEARVAELEALLKSRTPEA
jgi:BMFP domain-containing protein YqiC